MTIPIPSKKDERKYPTGEIRTIGIETTRATPKSIFRRQRVKERIPLKTHDEQPD
jgi:hypothetical protein